VLLALVPQPLVPADIGGVAHLHHVDSLPSGSTELLALMWSGLEPFLPLIPVGEIGAVGYKHEVGTVW
jgi:hypothetical protein